MLRKWQSSRLERDQLSRHGNAGLSFRLLLLREFPIKKGNGEADYLLFVEGAAAGVIEVKREVKSSLASEIRGATFISEPSMWPQCCGYCSHFLSQII